MEQKKTMNRGMAVLLSAALVPTVGVPATAFAEEFDQVQGGVQDGAVASNDATTPSTATGVTLTVNPAGVQEGTVYTSLAAALAAATDGSTIVLEGNVVENVAVDKDVVVDGKGEYAISGHTELRKGTLQNLTLTSVNSNVLTVGNTAADTNITMSGVTVKYPLTTAYNDTASRVLGGNNAAITIVDCLFTNDAQNNGVQYDAPQWSYGLYMNGQGSEGSLTFEHSMFKGAFRTMLPNINGKVTVKDSRFENSVFSVSPAPTGGSGGEATCITSADTGDATGFVIMGNTFDNAGSFYFQRTAGANVSGNEFDFDTFAHYIQVRGAAAAPLDLSDNRFTVGQNKLVSIDTTAAPIILPAGQRAVAYWAWDETPADVKPADYLTYEYAYNQDGSKSFYPGSFGALQAFINPAAGNIGVGEGETIYLQADILDAQGIAVPSGKDFTLDFGGHRYVVKDPGAGSTNTKTNAFQLLKDSNLTFKNGTIAVAEDAEKIKRIFQSYANVTFEDLTVDPTNQVGGEDYALSFNNGTIVMKGATNILASSSSVKAFDVCYWKTGGYDGGVSVTFDESFTGNVAGTIVYDSVDAAKASLSIAGSGSFGGIELSPDSKNGVTISITGGSFGVDPSAYVPTGYVTTPSNGKWVVSKYVPPAPPAPAPDTEVEQRPDGSTVTTVTGPDGSQTVTTEAADGSQSVVSKDADGNVTSAEVSVSDKAASDGAATLPLDPVKPAADAGEAPAVEVKVPASVTAEAPVKVTVPLDADEPGYGVVVFAVDADGNETVLPKCGVDADGNAVFEAAGDVTIKVVDAASEFPDVAGAWYGEQGVADFVSARGILTGIPQADGALRFEGDAATTRAMFVTMLHRAESCPDAEGAGFDDAAGLWFEEAAAWGEATGVVDGYGGSSFGGDDSVTREQMAVFLMRYAEHLGLDTSARADLTEFPDGSEASPWASRAMSWAVAEGLFSGRDGRLDPTDGATRAEASAVVMRFINGMYA